MYVDLIHLFHPLPDSSSFQHFTRGIVNLRETVPSVEIYSATHGDNSWPRTCPTMPDDPDTDTWWESVKGVHIRFYCYQMVNEHSGQGFELLLEEASYSDEEETKRATFTLKQ